MMKIFWASMGLFLGAFIATSSHTAVSAIEGESIVMSPVSESYELTAGRTISDTFKIINDGTVEYEFKVHSAPYSVADRTYAPNFVDEEANTDIYKWVTFSQRSWHLKPGENVDVPYTIEVPDEVTPGGHYGVLFAETQPNEDAEGTIIRKKRVGMIIYANVAGENIFAGEHVATKIDWLQLGGDLVATLTVNNTGNTHFSADESMVVKNIFGKQVFESTKERILLPKTTRDSVLAWENGPIMGLYNVSVESKILDKTSTTSSWVLLLPMWILVAMIVAIVGIVYYAFVRRRR